MENQNQILPIAKAGEVLGINDLDKLQAAAKRYGALVVVAGALLYINVDVFNSGVQSEIQTKAVQATNRATKKGEKGRSIGLLRARLSRAPELIANKEIVVEAAKQLLANAKLPYDKFVAKRKFIELEDSLKRLRENLVSDQAELDKILGEDPEA